MRKNQNFELLEENKRFSVQPARKGLHEGRLKPCGKNRCRICPLIDMYNIGSMITDRKFVPMLQKDVYCDQNMVVYAIRCSHCNIIYVGETKRKLKRRISEHLYNITQQKSSSSLVQHYKECPGKIRVCVLAFLERDADKHRLLELENQWIRALNAAYPFGLNENIKGYGIATDIADPVVYKNSPYLNFKVQGCHSKQRGQRKRQNKDVSPFADWERLKEIAEIEPSTVRYNKLYVTLKSFNKKSLQYCVTSASNGSVVNEKERELKIALAAMFSGWNRKEKVETKPKVKRFFMQYHKVLDSFNILSVLNDKKVIKQMPQKGYPDKYSIGYRYGPTIASFACNHNSFLRLLDDNSLKHLNKWECGCANNEYCYEPCGHVITGDLGIAKDDKIVGLLKQGAKYRLTEKPVLADILCSFENMLKEIMDWIILKTKCDKREFIQYKNIVQSVFLKKLDQGNRQLQIAV